MSAKLSILIIEDEKNICDFIAAALMNQDYRVFKSYSGMDGLSQITSRCPDILLLDLGLPDMDGTDIIRKVRKWSAMPIIVISARTLENEKVLALDLGADDYITKPFGMMEFVARVKAVLRRCSKQEDDKELRYGDLSLSVGKHKVHWKDTSVELTRKEFELLQYLMENKGLVMSRNQILCHVWGYDFDGETRTVDVHVRTLRQKLGEAGNLIETVRGVGYRIGV